MSGANAARTAPGAHLRGLRAPEHFNPERHFFFMATAVPETVETAAALQAIVARGQNYGCGNEASGRKVLVEFVSANPNGPLTLSHGRGGVLGDAIANLLQFAGAEVAREFYINDANTSGPMRRFVRAVLARYRKRVGAAPLPLDDEDSEYPAPYADALAAWVAQTGGAHYANLAPETALRLLTPALTFQVYGEQALTLARLGIGFDFWFNESDLHARGAVRAALARMKDGGHAYNHAGALWLRTSAFGDEADRALVRAGGARTYLAGDLAYHADKFARGYTDLVDVWGAEHAGYVARTRAGLAAMGYEPDKLALVLHGPVRLLKDGTEVRGGSLGGYSDTLTLAELLQDLDADTARFFLLLTPSARPLDVDADRARRQDATNPLWRVRQALGVSRSSGADTAADHPATPLILSFPDVCARAARELAPDYIARYAVTLADALLAAPDAGANRAGYITLSNALRLLGVGV